MLAGNCRCPAAPAGHDAESDSPTSTILLVVGAAGEETFGAQFQSWALAWTNHAQKARATLISVGLDESSGPTDKDRVRAYLTDEPKEGLGILWVVLIGHGTYDGQVAKFNLRGPDLSAAELKAWLEPFRRPLAVINTASSSGPFLNALSTTGRVVITATKSGFEQNFARFGHYFSEAIGDPRADLDKDDQISLLEAYLSASRQVAEFYEQEGRLATEHALLDDNADGLGTPADWFRGVRALKKAEEGASPDGLRAHQLHLIPSDRERQMPAEMRARRDALELNLAQLRDTKSAMTEEAYYRELEGLLVALARLYEASEARVGHPPIRHGHPQNP
jgi:hypothetical protein